MNFSERIIKFAPLVPILALSLIVMRLFVLQVIRGDKYLERSESNFIQERPIAHNRGLIFDQSGISLVDNRSSHDLYITLAMMLDAHKALKLLMPFSEHSSSSLKALSHLVNETAEKGEAREFLFAQGLASRVCHEALALAEREQIFGLSLRFAEDQSCALWINPLEFPTRYLAFEKLQKALLLSDEEMKVLQESLHKKAISMGNFKPILFFPDVDFDTYARVSAAISIGELPGVAVYDSKKRRYIYEHFAVHALGYLNEISQAELSKQKGHYRSGDRIGRRGIEAVYESVLRGEDGVERFVVDAKGRRYPEHLEKAFIPPEERILSPLSGNNLVLSIDKAMQDAAESGFLGKAGSVVAIEAKTGFILALASFPYYDANLLGTRNNHKIMKSLAADILKPWINKATQEHYAPGSTFKAVTAVAGLEHHLITPQTRQHCSGTFRLGNASWRCFKREGHGTIDMVQALKTSCDAYFYQLGYLLGPDRFADTARLLGFGRKTGIDLDVENAGIVPDRPYYIKRRGYYSPGLVVNTAIGQGDLTVTPMQLAVAYAAIVNGGTIYRPQLVRQEQDVQGKILNVHEPFVVSHLSEAKESLEQVKEGLAYVMEPGGTAYGVLYRYDLPELSKWLRESKVKIGGKTGTAQVVRLSKAIKHLRPEEAPYFARDHAWFVGFAPIDKPEIIVVAMTEHGGFGGTMSAPVVAGVVKAWFEKTKGLGRYQEKGEASAPQ